VIIAGTIGKSDVIDSIIASKKLNVAAIKGRWESFISEVVTSPLPGVDKALVIAGSDLRGTIFGLYDISEQIGVSPWYWFADVPVRRSDGIWALQTKKVQGSPSVKYRGIFINDEQPGLTNWIKFVIPLSDSRLCIFVYVYLQITVIIMPVESTVLVSTITSIPACSSYCLDSEQTTYGQQCGEACSTSMTMQTSLLPMPMGLLWEAATLVSSVTSHKYLAQYFG
jgi:hypothetical protein